MLNWDDLRYFMALADTGSLAGAARRLHVEHATIARRIAGLEHSLGIALVDRRGRRYSLTPGGERVAAHARAMEAEAFALERNLLGDAASDRIDLSVSAPPLLARLVAQALPNLRAAHPNIVLTLQGETRNVSLPRREADIALRLVRPQEDGLIIRKAGSLSYQLYGAKAYLRGRKASDYAFIAFDEALDDLPQQTWLKAKMGTRPIILRSNDLGVQAEAAAAGVGIAVLPRFVATSHALKPVSPRETAMGREIWVTYHRDLQRHPAVKAVVSFLASTMPRE